jgi:hypothetical protein
MTRSLLVLALLSGPVAAEAWPRGEGRLFAHLGGSSASASEVFDTSGARVPFPGRRYEESGDTLYLELGLAPRLTFVAAVPYRKVRADGLFNGFATSGFADLDARLRTSFPVSSSGWLAVEAGAFVPLGYSRNDFPELGSGHADAIVSAAFGASLAFLPEGFISAELGYRVRGGPIANEIPYALKVGSFPHPRVGLFAFARGWRSRADFGSVGETAGFLVSDSERLAVGLELYARVSRRFDVNVTYARVVSGRNVPIAHPVVVGVAFGAPLFTPRPRS